MVDAMKIANVQPKCKPLTNPINAADFTTAYDDTTLMALVEVLVTNQLTQTDIPTESTVHADNPRRYRTKRKEHWCSKIAEIQAELRAVKEEPKDSDTSSVISLQSGVSTTTTTPDIGKQATSSAILSKQMLENIPRFDGKQGNVDQFISQIEAYSKLYSVRKVELALLRTLSRPYEILSHAVAEDADVEWSQIRTKLINNYSVTRGEIDAGIKLRNIKQLPDESVGEYCARAKTLIKAKFPMQTQYLKVYDKLDAHAMIKGLRPILPTKQVNVQNKQLQFVQRTM